MAPNNLYLLFKLVNQHWSAVGWYLRHDPTPLGWVRFIRHHSHRQWRQTIVYHCRGEKTSGRDLPSQVGCKVCNASTQQAAKTNKINPRFCSLFAFYNYIYNISMYRARNPREDNMAFHWMSKVIRICVKKLKHLLSLWLLPVLVVIILLSLSSSEDVFVL